MKMENIRRSPRIIYSPVIIIPLLVAFNFWFYNHYMNLINQPDNIFKAIFIINIGFGVYSVSVFKFKNILNPLGIYALFIFGWGFSYLQLSDRQTSYNYYTEWLIIISIISFLTGSFLQLKPFSLRIKYLKSFDIKSLKVILFTVISIGLITFAYEIKQIGYMPIFNATYTTYSDVIESVTKFTFIHYLVLFLSLVPAILYIYYKKNSLNLITFITLNIVCLFVLLNLLGRQNILIMALSLLFAYNYFKPISNLKIIIFSVLGIVFFILIGNIRGDNSSLDLANYWLKHYTDIQYETSIIETYLTLYSSLNFTTLDKIVTLSLDNDYTGYGIYTFRPIISFFFLDRIGIVNYDPDYNGFMQLGTYALEPFLDFKLFGVVFINILYGHICSSIYDGYANHRSYISIIAWTLIAYCTFMTVFTNYYHVFFIWFALIISYFLLNMKTKASYHQVETKVL